MRVFACAVVFVGDANDAKKDIHIQENKNEERK
jgi:hypothetical protein